MKGTVLGEGEPLHLRHKDGLPVTDWRYPLCLLADNTLAFDDSEGDAGPRWRISKRSKPLRHKKERKSRMTERRLRMALEAIAAGDMTREAIIERAKSALVREEPSEPPDWTGLGRQLRYAAEDAFETTPSVDLAYEFLQFHPEVFPWIRRPEDMPTDPPAELRSAYERAANEARLIHQGY
jgi:hypothetical protein